MRQGIQKWMSLNTWKTTFQKSKTVRSAMDNIYSITSFTWSILESLPIYRSRYSRMD